MTQFVYWHAPLWQVVMVAMAGLLLLAWLLLLVGHRPKTSPTLAAVDPALDDQPVIYFDPVRGFIALNSGARLTELRYYAYGGTRYDAGDQTCPEKGIRL